MSDQQQPRPPLWRDVDNAWWAHVDTEPLVCPPSNDQAASVIRAFAQYLTDHGPTYIDTDGKPAFCMGARLLEVLEQEAKRAEAGE